LVSAPPTRLVGKPSAPWGISTSGSLSCSQEVHPLTSFPPLQSQPDMLTASQSKTARPFARPRLAASRDTTHRNFGPLPAHRATPLMRFFAPSAPSEPGVLFSACAPGDKSPFAARRPQACLTCSLAASRVSHPLDGFLLPGPRRFVSPDRHPWGFEPYRSTSATGAGPKARWLPTSLGLDEQARPHREK
jgi:hypothetical protein